MLVVRGFSTTSRPALRTAACGGLVHGRGGRGRPGTGDRTGLLVEFDNTDALFTHPVDRRTEDYVTGRFG